MKIRTRLALLGTVATAALLAGCSSTPLDTGSTVPIETRTGTPVKPGTPGAAGGSGATASGAPQSSVATVDLAAQNAAAAAAAAAAASSQRVVYFDYDSFVIKDEFKPVVDGHARALISNKGKRITVEGHTDERGGREYNLALGQKRAEAVARSLTLLGVGAAQVEAVSFGEERPASAGAEEQAWARNRRAELRDR